jgi:hypothetical protein
VFEGSRAVGRRFQAAFVVILSHGLRVRVKSGLV